MFVVKIIRSIRGYITFSATGGFIERAINLISNNNINIWDIRKNKEVFYINVLAKDYKQIKKLAKKADVNTRVCDRIGIYFLLKKYKKRIGVVIGISIFLFFIMFMQNFIWTIDVTGNQTIDTQQVLDIVAEYGIKKGALVSSLDFRDIQQQAITKFNNISWLAINHVGSSVSIEIREGIVAPEIKDKSTTRDIIAKKSGKIISMKILEGEQRIKIGDYVVEGDTLVNGVFEDALGNVLSRPSEAEIIAETNYEQEFIVSLNNQEKVYTGIDKNRYIIEIFGLKLPLYIATKIKSDYDITTEKRELKIFGITTPFYIYKNNYKFYELKDVVIHPDQAKELIQNQISKFESETLSEVKIINKDLKEYEILEDKIKLKVSYICNEDIAVQQDVGIAE